MALRPIFVRLILPFFFHLHQSLQDGSFPSDFHIKALYAFHLSPLIFQVSHRVVFVDLITRALSGDAVEIIKVFIMQFSPVT